MRAAAVVFALLGCAPTVLIEERREGPAPGAATAHEPPCVEGKWPCEACLAEASEGACSADVATCEAGNCSTFDGCYQGGVWSGIACEAEHPAEARLWRALVGCVCDRCAAACCRRCSLPWGVE